MKRCARAITLDIRLKSENLSRMCQLEHEKLHFTAFFSSLVSTTTLEGRGQSYCGWINHTTTYHCS